MLLPLMCQPSWEGKWGLLGSAVAGRVCWETLTGVSQAREAQTACILEKPGPGEHAEQGWCLYIPTSKCFQAMPVPPRLLH